ncbi:replication protein [Human papillomavirus 139]|uniref:Replication protein E1 n=1 Tax=Human papillomavirus 139 TaxID=1070412 RepID=I6MRE3_9PAPI|nr:replication protein [Human papillomavirus 139]
MADKGINSPNSLEGCSEWYIVHEAECDEELTDLEKLFDESDCSVISNLIDDGDETDQGNPLALLNQQLLEESNQQLLDLKRKFISPLKESEVDLSPQLQAVSLSAGSKNSRRRLFEDSGLGNEAENSVETTQVTDSGSSGDATAEQSQANTELADVNGGSDICQELLKSRNAEIKALAIFKETFGLSYKDLTRPFKSNKTCCNSWVLAVFGVQDELFESSKILLQTHCVFVQSINYSLASSVLALYLCEFKTSKNRETVYKLMCQLLQCKEIQIMADPPKIKSLVVALYFYKQSFSSTCFKYGEFPEWIKKQTIVSHQADAETFQIGKMVQFAYDHDIVDDSELAYAYASSANEDANATAWLNSNQQAKYLKDAIAMVRHYKRYEMKSMSMTDWIWHCCDKKKEDGDWKVIPQFLKYQDVNFIMFLSALRAMFHNVPKKQCIVITGPPNTGKSYFCFGLVHFLEGKVVSFMNHKSHFWLQPLKECKIGFLDDATFTCWQFIDTFMRNALDGTPVCIDSKHSNPVQMKLPPMLITSNVEVEKEQQFYYLHSRLQVFNFPRKMPLDENGNPVYKITDASWNSFFRKLEKQLDICRSTDPKDGDSERALRCFAGESANAI